MQLVRNRILLAKVEATPGTDSVPVVASNAVETKSPIAISWSGNVLKRDNIRASISPAAPILGQRWADITFQVELRGSGTKGVAGQLTALLQACAMTETVSAGSSVVYLPNSASQKTLTMYIYNMDTGSAVLQKFTGCVGDWSWAGKAGDLSYLNFNFKGLFNEPTDVALPTSPTYETTVAPVIQSAAFTINSISDLVIQQLSLGLGNTIAMRDDISSANGLKGFFITARQAKGSFNPEASAVADYDKWTDWASSNQRALSVQVGATAGNICTITAPKVVIESIKDGDKSGIQVHEIAFNLGLNAGDDEVQLKFT